LHLNFSKAIHLNKLNLLTIPLLSYIYLKELWKAFIPRTANER
jgi:hypothetical protein